MGVVKRAGDGGWSERMPVRWWGRAAATAHKHQHDNQLALPPSSPPPSLPLSSQVGSVDDNRSGGGYAYRASKSALNIVNKSMSIDLAGDGVTCVLLHPGGLVDWRGDDASAAVALYVHTHSF